MSKSKIRNKPSATAATEPAPADVVECFGLLRTGKGWRVLRIEAPVDGNLGDCKATALGSENSKAVCLAKLQTLVENTVLR